MWCLCFFDRNGEKERLYNSEKTVATIVCHEVRIHEVKSRDDMSSLWSCLDSPDNSISKQERMFIAKDLNLHPSSHISKTIKDHQRPNPGKAPRISTRTPSGRCAGSNMALRSSQRRAETLRDAETVAALKNVR
jgi:hypothetical protein